VIARNPGPFTFTGTGTYIVGRDEGPLAVVDPGPDDPEHLAALLQAIGGAPVSHVLVTHAHRDHCRGARAFSQAVGAPIHAGVLRLQPSSQDDPPVEEGADLAFRPDVPLTDGQILAADGWTLEAVATPGHFPNHFCFALTEEAALFSGDHVMGWSTTVVAPPEGDMSDYLASIDKLMGRDDAIYFPTHGPPIARPKAFLRAVRAHRAMRDAQILDQLKRGKTTIREMIPAIYAGLDKRLHGAAALTVYAHLIRLVRAGAVATDGPPARDGVYRLV
jgi:glyoxylase-like metal-dependent hydrolase (beta-lactamase superfamily II)